MSTAVWRRLLLALCALAACWIAVEATDQLGLGGRPWMGWWDSEPVPTHSAFTLRFQGVRAGGATDRAGIRTGDAADLRNQTYEARAVLLTQPLSTQPTVLRLKRGTRTLALPMMGSTVWDGQPIWKLSSIVPTILAGITFLVCALLITLRRANTRDGRFLALVLLALVPGFFAQNPIVFPNATITLTIFPLTPALGLIALVLLVALSSQHGTRAGWRSVVEKSGYAVIGLAAVPIVASYIASMTLAFDPAAFWWDSRIGAAATAISTLATAIVCVTAALSAPQLERARSLWLLLPLPLALLGGAIILISPNSPNWFVGLALNIASSGIVLVGALLVTYAVLKRRVLDFEFVLSRTLVFATVSLVVVGCFALLEWLLGSVLAGVSHATGLVANGVLALALGLSLNALHKRVDAFIDSIFFRKRHEDEHALRDFAKEAAFVTEPDVLLDIAIAKVRNHTDARNAQILLDNGRTYESIRFFGEPSAPSVSENDEAVLALKTWHKPLDPHRYNSALHGALAIPMLARGRVLGILVLGERAGGEAYSPDEIEALAQLAHGVSSTLDVLSVKTSDVQAVLQNFLRMHIEPMRRQLDAISQLLQTDSSGVPPPLDVARGPSTGSG